MTVAVTAVTAAVSIPALAIPQLVTALQQDPTAFAQGQVWRLVTPMLVQGYGLGQFLFNLVGVVLAGIAVESRSGPARWLAVYLAAGIAAVVLTSVWFPVQTDSGASAGVAGLIGAFVVGLVTSRTYPPLPSLMYAVYFVAYLTGMAYAGVLPGAIAGVVALAVLALARRRLGEPALATGIAVVVAVGAVAMLLHGDPHGVGLLVGAAVAAPLCSAGQPSPSRERRADPAG